MYLIDDIIYHKPTDKQGIVRGIQQNQDGNIFYDIEIDVEGSSNGTYHISAVSDEELEYAGSNYQ